MLGALPTSLCQNCAIGFVHSLEVGQWPGDNVRPVRRATSPRVVERGVQWCSMLRESLVPRRDALGEAGLRGEIRSRGDD